MPAPPRGLTVAQLGDLGAMAGLSMIDPRGIAMLRSRSILQLTRGDATLRESIGEATDFDLGYLAALYSGEPGYSADQEVVRLATSMTHRRH